MSDWKRKYSVADFENTAAVAWAIAFLFTLTLYSVAVMSVYYIDDIRVDFRLRSCVLHWLMQCSAC